MPGRLVGRFERLLQPECSLAEFDSEPPTAQFARQGQGGWIDGFAQWRNVGVGLLGCRGLLRLEGQNEPIFATFARPAAPNKPNRSS